MYSFQAINLFSQKTFLNFNPITFFTIFYIELYNKNGSKTIEIISILNLGDKCEEGWVPTYTHSASFSTL